MLIPLLGSPALVAGLALTKRRTASAGDRARLAPASRRPTGRTLDRRTSASVVAVAIVAAAVRPGVLVQPGAAYIASVGGKLFESREDEIASVQAGQITFTPELWVAGTSMTLLTVDAKLMPVLPLIARPESKDVLVVAFGMGSAFRGALIAGLRTDGVELVPSVPEMFGHYYADAAAVLADPNGRVIVTDGRNHLELTRQALRHHHHRPAAADRELGRRRHLLEGVLRGRPRPPHRRRDHDAVAARTAARRGFQRPHPDVHFGLPGGHARQGRRRLRRLHARVVGADRVRRSDIRAILARPGVLEDISSAYDSPAKTVDAWVDVINRQTWVSGSDAARPAGPGPLVTDDRPRTEYFLLRRLFDGMAP